MASRQRYKGPFKKGMTVFLRSFDWSNGIERTDFKNQYRIRSIGNQEAILDSINSNGETTPYGGSKYSLYSKEYHDRQAEQGRRAWNCPYKWEMRFTLVGEEGWDPAINFY